MKEKEFFKEKANESLRQLIEQEDREKKHDAEHQSITDFYKQ